MKRNIWFWRYFIVAIILAIYFSVRIIMIGTGHSPISYVRNISISADQNNKDLSALAAAAQIAPNTRTYSIDLDEMNKRIGAVPGVKESAVRRIPNGNLIVRAKLYHAVALWSDGEMYFPLSADGTIVNQPTTERNMANVVFRGTVPSDISHITEVAHNLVGHLEYIEWIENRRWNVHTTNGITIMLPEENPIPAMGTLIGLNNKHQILDRKIKIIDMRDPSRILIK